MATRRPTRQESEQSNPELSRRQLRLALREARDATGQTQRQVAASLRWSLSKMIRIEAGAVGVSVTDVRALLDEYGIPSTARERFEDLAIASRGPSWTKAYKEYFSDESLKLFQLEQVAKRLSKHEPSLIPGLLQNSEYSEAVIRALGVTDERRLEALVGARIERQELLLQPERPTMHFVLGEAAVSRPVGGAAVMRRQLQRLIELSQDERVTIQVMPFTAGIHRKLGESFTVLEFEDATTNDALYLENAGRETIGLEDPQEIADYLIAFQAISELATPAAEVEAFLKQVIAARFDGDD